MIAHLKGKVLKKTDKGIILSPGNIGYFVHITKDLLSTIEKEAEFFIHTHIKEDAQDLVDSLNKKFKKISFPHEEVTAKITIVTPLLYHRGNKKGHDVLRTLQVQEKLVSIFKQNGWVKENQLLSDICLLIPEVQRIYLSLHQEHHLPHLCRKSPELL